MLKPTMVIVGYGEVGQAIAGAFADLCRVVVDDQTFSGTRPPDDTDVLHVCFPWSDSFVTDVHNYQAKYYPAYTVIHSTVPPGTSIQCGAVHSPVIGKHPYLRESLYKFTKWLGGKHAGAVARYFTRAGMKVYVTDLAYTSELMKVLSTTTYGLLIEWTKEVKRLCDKGKVPFEAYTLWTQMYNQGYHLVGHPEYHRPELIPIVGPIGGHCVLPNTEFIESRFADLIRMCNQEERGE